VPKYERKVDPKVIEAALQKDKMIKWIKSRKNAGSSMLKQDDQIQMAKELF
jgi:hypothetical protein